MSRPLREEQGSRRAPLDRDSRDRILLALPLHQRPLPVWRANEIGDVEALVGNLTTEHELGEKVGVRCQLINNANQVLKAVHIVGIPGNRV